MQALATDVARAVRGVGTVRGGSGLPPGRGRGSSVSSIVCFLIGLSHIDPIRNRLSFKRFINEDSRPVSDLGYLVHRGEDLGEALRCDSRTTNRSLEAELGLTLLERDRRGVRLTPEGAGFAGRATTVGTVIEGPVRVLVGASRAHGSMIRPLGYAPWVTNHGSWWSTTTSRSPS